MNKDQEQLKAVQDFLKDGQVSIDIFGIVRTDPPASQPAVAGKETEPRLASTFAVGEESSSFGAPQNYLTAAAEVIGGRFGAHQRDQAGDLRGRGAGCALPRICTHHQP